jgi:tetratricopeptide (TPR) repeat protein
MPNLRLLVLVLSTAPGVTLAAQAAPRAATIRIPDLSWLAPQVAAARAGAVTAMAGVGPAMAAVAPVLAQARVGLAHARAALEVSRVPMGAYGFGSTFAIADDYDRIPPEPWAQEDPADQLYRSARRELNRGRYATAADLFADIYTKYPRSTYAGDAYYWQAYALSKRDSDEARRKALDVLKRQQEKAPNASTRSDADALAARIQGELAQSGDPRATAAISSLARAATTPAVPAAPAAPVAPAIAGSGHSSSQGKRDRCDSDDDMQSAALNALQQMDPDKALPILKRVLARRDPGSQCLRRKAVFIVSQNEGPGTERILLDVARTDPDLEVREQAVQWLSQVDSPGAVTALDSILRSASDPALQDKAIFALSQQDSPKARQALRDFALRPSVSDDLREKAIFWISQGDDPDRLGFLKSLYGQLHTEPLRDKVLFSVSQIEGRESQQWLLQVAGDANEDIELRKKALFWVGQSDMPVGELFTIYDRLANREMKEHMIFVISQRDERAAVDKLIQIAKTETDRELKKKAVFWLSQSDDPRVAEFLASLLEKP